MALLSFLGEFQEACLNSLMSQLLDVDELEGTLAPNLYLMKVEKPRPIELNGSNWNWKDLLLHIIISGKKDPTNESALQPEQGNGKQIHRMPY
jgi:hypothetical protein